jgi:hypothetical protein
VSTIQKIINTLDDVFDELQVVIEPPVLETIAITIHRAMTLRTRSFHTLDHIFTLADKKKPVHALAAFFHDIVYYQVDHGFQPEIWLLISPFIEEKAGYLFITQQVKKQDRTLQLTLDIFGFKLGQKLLPLVGLNEFLSALTMNKQLVRILSEKVLYQITACIEATIPFRGENDHGESCFDQLETRLKGVNQKFGLALGNTEIENIVRSAVIFANQDVVSFADEDPGQFLDNTWKLLPETNQPLQSGEQYSIKDYRQALQKMAGFFEFLNPDTIFHRYRGAPTEPEFQSMVRLAHQNVEIARDYLAMKLLPMVILEALAEASGGDAPLALFMGDVRKADEESTRLEDYLFEVEINESQDQTSTVFRLLNEGRASASGFDMKNSPLTAFLYKSLGDEGIKLLAAQAKKFLADELKPQAFLSQIPKTVLSAIAKASSMMALTRSQALSRYILPS